MSHGEGKFRPGVKKATPGQLPLLGGGGLRCWKEGVWTRGLIRSFAWPRLPCSYQPPVLEGPLAGPKGGSRWVSPRPVPLSPSQLPGAAPGVCPRECVPGLGSREESGAPGSRGHRLGSRVQGKVGRGVRERVGKPLWHAPPPPRVPTPWEVKGHSRFLAEEEGATRALGFLPVQNPLRCGASWAVCISSCRGQGCNAFLPGANAPAAGAGSSPGGRPGPSHL